MYQLQSIARMTSVAICICFFLHTVISAAEDPPKLRVFILAGQSNMEGKGAIEHLEQLAASGEAAYQQLRKGEQWKQRGDVSIQFFEKHGPLTVGYGKPENRIGPEFGFGHAVGDRYDEHVLLIKTAWGGRSLAVDFRPPSSGIGKFQKRDRKTKELVSIPEEEYGTAYLEMIAEVRRVLKDIDQYVPAGVAANGYEVSGFVWFQGFNDIINDGYSAEYAANLANLIRDVRRDLGVADLPVIIGELGQQGTTPEKRYEQKHVNFRRQQKSVAEMPEFKRTVSFVKTSPHIIKDAESFDGGYHYFGRADTFWNIGQDFGKEMLLLCRDVPVNHSAKVRLK